MNMFHLVDIKNITFEFQVGPLLDWVASLRACTGYPDPALVAQASYLNENKVRLSHFARSISEWFLFVSLAPQPLSAFIKTSYRADGVDGPQEMEKN